MRLPLILFALVATASAADAAQRLASDEALDRGAFARRLADGRVQLGWRLLPGDAAGTGFHVGRKVGEGGWQRLTDEPHVRTTDFFDEAPAGALRYSLGVAGGDETVELAVADGPASPCIRIPLQGEYTFQKVGIADLDGDRALDFVIKQPHANIDPWHKYWKKSPETYQIEAYGADGTFRWRYDMGWAIERGKWYSPFIVYDLDGDGRAEVALKAGEGDPRDEEGKVRTGPEHVRVLDGATGETRAQAPWPSRELFAGIKNHRYNYESRNQIGVAHLGGKTASLIVARGTYNVMAVEAWRLEGDKLERLWRWDNRKLDRKHQGQGAHNMVAADVDGDGKDEVLIGSICLDDDGSVLWCTGLGHPDHMYLGDIDPAREGWEIYYGIETRAKQNGMCLVDAKTGGVIWGHREATRHVHSYGMCADLDAKHPGWECYSCDTDAKKKPFKAFLRTATGKVIGQPIEWKFGRRTALWDADPQREILLPKEKGVLHLVDYGGEAHPTAIEGRYVAAVDILGDWREEIIASVPGELRIYLSPIPAKDRRTCLLNDAIYRTYVAHASMGYDHVPMLGRALSPAR